MAAPDLQDQAGLSTSGGDNGEEEDSTLLLGATRQWLSEEEKARTSFRLMKAAAEELGFDGSPFFPKTAGDFVGLKAATLEAEARKLRALVEEKERVMRRKRNACWEPVVLLMPSGRAEVRLVPVYHGAPGAGVDEAS